MSTMLKQGDPVMTPTGARGTFNGEGFSYDDCERCTRVGYVLFSDGSQSAWPIDRLRAVPPPPIKPAFSARLGVCTSTRIEISIEAVRNFGPQPYEAAARIRSAIEALSCKIEVPG